MSVRLRRFEISGGGEPSTAHKLQAFQVRGYGQTGGPDGRRERGDDAPFLSQLGVYARPVIRRGLRALGLVDDTSVTLLGLFDRALVHEPAPESGETRIYGMSAPKVCIRLLGGRIEIRVGAPDNEILLGPDAMGYAGKSVARVDDEVQVTIPAGSVVVAIGPGGAPVLNAPMIVTGKVNAGAPRVKA